MLAGICYVQFDNFRHIHKMYKNVGTHNHYTIAMIKTLSKSVIFKILRVFIILLPCSSVPSLHRRQSFLGCVLLAPFSKSDQ